MAAWENPHQIWEFKCPLTETKLKVTHEKGKTSLQDTQSQTCKKLPQNAKATKKVPKVVPVRKSKPNMKANLESILDEIKDFWTDKQQMDKIKEEISKT